MKPLAHLIIALSLSLALVSLSSAYLVDLGRTDAELLGLNVSEDVPVLQPDGIARRNVVEKGQTLDGARLAALRAAGVERVRVEEFAFERWEQSWLFLLALAGLGVGAFLARRAAAASVAAQAALVGAGGSSPTSELAAIERIVEELLRDWDERVVRGREREHVRSRLGLAIEEHGPAFVAAREVLVAELGLGGYAGLMDRFAAAERQLHRAWSAAADGVLEETHVCLQRARIMLAESRDALDGAGV